MPLTQRAVESIYPFVDQIIAIDGKYADFPGEEQYSTDGTLEYLRSLEKVSLILSPPLIEPDKRNLYLVGSEGDWYIHLDADEEWTGNFYLPKSDMGVVWLKRQKNQPYMQRVRIFKHIPGIHYEKKHYWLHDRNGNTYALLDKPGKNYKAEEIKGALILHHEDDRPVERQQTKKQYYRVLRKRENPHREVL